MEIDNKGTEEREKTESAMKPGTEFGDEKNAASDDLMNKVKDFLDFSFETIRVVVVSLIIIFVVRSFVIQPFFVKGSSMQPNFHDGDYLIVDEISYGIGEPQRGDVIIFKYPNNPSEFFIKRVIGLPGESVELKNNTITIYNNENPTGFVLDESAYLARTVTTSGDEFKELASDEYYVLGDNRIASSDSRAWGVLKDRYIIGRAWVRAWPFDSFQVFESLSYEE